MEEWPVFIPGQSMGRNNTQPVTHTSVNNGKPVDSRLATSSIVVKKVRADCSHHGESHILSPPKLLRNSQHNGPSLTVYFGVNCTTAPAAAVSYIYIAPRHAVG